MTLRNWRFIVLLLSALTVGMKFAHVLELAPKLQYEPELYLAVQTSLYQVFGTIGPILDVGAILSAFALAWMVRRRPAFRLTLAGAASALVSILVWLLVVAPANMPINEWLATGIMPDNWMAMRSQWQFGQSASFVFDLLGFSLLLIAVLRETPTADPTA